MYVWQTFDSAILDATAQAPHAACAHLLDQHNFALTHGSSTPVTRRSARAT